MRFNAQIDAKCLNIFKRILFCSKYYRYILKLKKYKRH